MEISILSLLVCKHWFLGIDFSTKGTDELEVCFNALLIVIILFPLVFIQTVKSLFKVQQLVLKTLIVSLFLSKFLGFKFQLLNQPIFVVGLLAWHRR